MESRPALGPTKSPIQWVQAAKRQGRETDHSRRSYTEAKKTWVYTSTPPYVFMLNYLNTGTTLPVPAPVNVFTGKIDIHSENHSYLLRSWALLEEPPIMQPLKNFQAFHGTQRFNIVFTRALHWSLSWAISIQSTPSHPISVRSILILSTHLRLGLPSGLFPSGFPTNIL
jgi:hypothetical protein